MKQIEAFYSVFGDGWQNSHVDFGVPNDKGASMFAEITFAITKLTSLG